MTLVLFTVQKMMYTENKKTKRALIAVHNIERKSGGRLFLLRKKDTDVNDVI